MLFDSQKAPNLFLVTASAGPSESSPPDVWRMETLHQALYTQFLYIINARHQTAADPWVLCNNRRQHLQYRRSLLIPGVLRNSVNIWKKHLHGALEVQSCRRRLIRQFAHRPSRCMLQINIIDQSERSCCERRRPGCCNSKLVAVKKG